MNRRGERSHTSNLITCVIFTVLRKQGERSFIMHCMCLCMCGIVLCAVCAKYKMKLMSEAFTGSEIFNASAQTQIDWCQCARMHGSIPCASAHVLVVSVCERASERAESVGR